MDPIISPAMRDAFLVDLGRARASKIKPETIVTIHQALIRDELNAPWGGKRAMAIKAELEELVKEVGE